MITNILRFFKDIGIALRVYRKVGILLISEKILHGRRVYEKSKKNME